MSNIDHHPLPPAVDPTVIEAFRAATTPSISDNLDRLPNIPVSIGGWTVNPGDVVVGDEDGVVTFSPAIASSLIEAVRAQERREAEVLQMIRAGRYDGRYGRVTAA